MTSNPCAEQKTLRDQPTSYENLAQAPLGDNLLAQIASTARDILAAQDAVADCEESLKTAQARLRTLKEDVMPELMSVAGQEQVKTADGLIVSIKELVRGQPSKDNEAQAFAWLRDSGNGGIIKSKLEADLGKADQEKIKAALDALAPLGIRAAPKQSVAWQTLGALVREKLSKGEVIPLDLLGVHMWKQAEVKSKG
jgi:hypothetical protein